MAASLVVLDPGHGGHDPGAVGHGVQEKDVVLAVCHRVHLALSRRGIASTSTRRTDTYLTLTERARRANELKADAFVSVHCNAAESPKAEGIETFHFPGSRPSEDLAHAVQAELVTTFCTGTRAAAHKNRGVKTARFTVLQKTAMPAVLVECEFVSHAEQAAFLADPAQQERIARAIADGVTAWLLHRCA